MIGRHIRGRDSPVSRLTSSLAHARAHNASQPAGSLPTETLWEIFAWICFSGSRDPIHPNAPEMTAVFSHWRHAALSYSPIWEDISIASDGARSLGHIVQPPSYYDYRRIGEHAKRAKGNLNIRIACRLGHRLDELSVQIMRVYDYSGLFRRLEIDIPRLDDVPSDLFPLPKDLRNLVKLTVSVGTELGPLDTRFLPRLLENGTILRPVELSLDGEFLPTLSLLDASRLQKASLTYTDLADIRAIRHLLREARNIRSLELRSPSTVRETAASLNAQRPSDFVSPTLECLSAGRNWDTVLTLINPRTIRHLRLIGLATPPHSFATFIPQFTALQSLCLFETTGCLPHCPREEEHNHSGRLPSWLAGKYELVVLALPYTVFALPAGTIARACAPSHLPALRFVIIFDDRVEPEHPEVPLHAEGELVWSVIVNDLGQYELISSSSNPICIWQFDELEAKREMRAIRASNPNLHVTYHRVGQPPSYDASLGDKNWDVRHTEAMRDVVRANERGDMRWLGERGLLT